MQPDLMGCRTCLEADDAACVAVVLAVDHAEDHVGVLAVDLVIGVVAVGQAAGRCSACWQKLVNVAYSVGILVVASACALAHYDSRVVAGCLGTVMEENQADLVGLETVYHLGS